LSTSAPVAVAVFGFALISITSCTHLKPPPTPSGQCSGSAAENKAVVLAFYDLALVRRSPREAFAAFATEDMVEHKPDIPGGTRDAVVAYLEALMGELPNARWEILRSAAEGDLVFIHARFTIDKGQPSYAIADVFRLANCKIVEHWDVVGAPREQQPNPVSRF
jgi:predicted SnoaL-like aldol condensation-catalyzing enzyme